ncbi:hypothetical protein CLPU_2c02090 [Gottschalkia purinilytica]|uniref:Rpn family recombination-promoting nuclease/putative transposase n=1 Tax=Gottschalkia purinilytica TaxID=1503 RepID=A0A0L0WE50_GOTPU|nr:Rpn family recombination-promoting nuclease/putative transposase [Gottschalkia purinilytica]KNF09757.1 hypothetical protein CLPU_2c02090 [Gottschalkia purinilytica]
MVKKGISKVRRIESNEGFLMSPKNDFAFKMLFGDPKNKDILISFLSAVMKIKEERFEELELINTELTREFVEDKKGILDIRVKLKDGTEIDIEIQLSYTKYMAERTLFYWSRMYTGNIESGDSYSKLRKCVTINILDFVSTPLDKVHSKYHIIEDDTSYKLTDVLEIHFLELPKLRDEKLKGKIDEDDETVEWMMFLEADKKEVLDVLGNKNEKIKKATSILEIMSKDKKTRMLYEAREAELHDQATKIEEAREEGEYKKAVKIAKNLIKKGMEVEFIKEVTELTQKEIEELKNQMNN